MPSPSAPIGPTAASGGPTGVVEAAIARLDEEFGLFNSSPIILNAADGGAGRDFANAVALIESDLDPVEMLARLKAIGKRVRPAQRPALGTARARPRYRPVERRRYRSRRLTIPHPQLACRTFVLQPLAAIAPGWRVGGP